MPMAGAIALAVRGFEPAAVVSALFTGVFLTPVAYYMAMRFSFALGGAVRRRPFTTLLVAAAATGLVVMAVRVLTAIAGPQ